jgi:two-component system NtrC family sensor kinase
VTTAISIVNRAPESVYLVDEQGRFCYVNDEACRVSGYSREELLSLRVSDLDQDLPIQDWPAFWSEIPRHCSFSYESWHRTKQGQVFPVEVAVKYFECDGRGFILDLVSDATGGDQEEPARTAIHDIGNVLNGLKVSTTRVVNKLRNSKASSLTRVVDLLDAHTMDLAAFVSADPKGKQIPIFLKNLAKQITDEKIELMAELQGMAEKVEHIRAIAYGYQGRRMIRDLPAPVSVVEFVEAALRIATYAVESREVHVIRRFEQTARIVTDTTKVLQILVNLITNASQALEQGRQRDRQLTLQIESKGTQRVRISVADNGIGIASGSLHRIFEQGFTTREDGHGLGLHGSARLAKELGGDLMVTSNGPGQGAVFTLELPVQNVARSPDSKDDTSDPHQR